MGKTRLIAETGAGQHGVATATAAALMGMECVVFMGEEDTKRQALNVYRMRLLGAEVIPVTSGTGTLKDAVSEAMREWTSRISDTHYCLGSVMGPHPFPTIVRDFQAVISKEIKEQMLEKEGRLPDAVNACVGGGSNAIGSFYNFIEDKNVRLIGCEAAGRGIDTFETAATINTGRLGIFHGMKSYFCQDEYGQIAPVYSISVGLDYPGIGPEHAWLHDIGRAEYVAITDDEAVTHLSIWHAPRASSRPLNRPTPWPCYQAGTHHGQDQIIVITISGRGDKDCAAIAHYRGRIFMSNIAKAFANGKAFIPFITCGDQDLATTAAAVRAMAANGADLIELGIRSQTPPPKARHSGANIRALKAGTTTDKVFDFVREVRKDVSIPLVFMTYANVVFSYGAERFISTCAEIGIDGMILPDLPYEEKDEFLPICRKYGVDLISMIALPLRTALP
ncbi:MAG: tryptophan synthase subunit beta [Hydrogeniiclostridium mannosilyticum]